MTSHLTKYGWFRRRYVPGALTHAKLWSSWTKKESIIFAPSTQRLCHDCQKHSLANRHSCSTSAETRDRKCFSMQLILVVGKVDMINQICQMLSIILLKVIVSLFCWKKWLLSTLLSTVVTAKCAFIRNTNVCFFQCMHADQVFQHFNLLPNFEL